MARARKTRRPAATPRSPEQQRTRPNCGCAGRTRLNGAARPLSMTDVLVRYFQDTAHPDRMARAANSVDLALARAVDELTHHLRTRRKAAPGTRIPVTARNVLSMALGGESVLGVVYPDFYDDVVRAMDHAISVRTANVSAIPFDPYDHHRTIVDYADGTLTLRSTLDAKGAAARVADTTAEAIGEAIEATGGKSIGAGRGYAVVRDPQTPSGERLVFPVSARWKVPEGEVVQRLFSERELLARARAAIEAGQARR